VATNQCAGAAVSCINISERLNSRLQYCQSSAVKMTESAAFSIAMNGTEARLFISWKHDNLTCYMQKVKSFLIQKHSDYVEFRKCVLNIIDWGRGKRFQGIRESLAALLEDSRRIPA